MPITCRLLALTPPTAASVIADSGVLADALASARNHSDVYRYWHAIEYLLGQHRPDLPVAKWLRLGQPVSAASGDVPAARVVPAEDVAQLAAALREIEPEALAPHYDAEALDQAGIYPRQWREWEETFDPLGQVLEHYSFLREFAGNCASTGDALLLYFKLIAEGALD